MELAKKSFKLKIIYKPKLVYQIAYYLIASVLLISGISKIIDPLPLLETIKLLTIIHESLQIFIATLLPIVEIGLAVLMLLKIKPPVSAKRFSSEDGKLTFMAVTILFAIFLAFSIYGTTVGFGGDCGCFGNVVKSEFGWGMILRNTIFFILSLTLTINAWPSRITNK